MQKELVLKHRGEFLIFQAFEYRRKMGTKGKLRILSQRSCGYERSSRGRLGNLMERDRGGTGDREATERHMQHESLKSGF